MNARRSDSGVASDEIPASEDVSLDSAAMNVTSVRQIPLAQAAVAAVAAVASDAGLSESILGAHADEAKAALETLGVGTVVDGKYRIDAILGRGAMGVVVSATHLDLRETVALKFLNLRVGAKGDDFHLRFRREAQLCAKLRSEHVARVIDVGVWQERTPYMVMEHLAGHDLSQIIKARGPLPLDVALDYIVQVCVGLAEAHGIGVVHRDLKPSNLFITQRSDGSDLVKILDFGISKWSVEDDIGELTQSGVVLGSPKYMAVEQLFGSANVDSRADVWSIGAIFYAMLSGKSPYDFPTITRLCAELATNNPPTSLRVTRPEVPPALDAALMRCFERDRERRVQNVGDLAGDLLDAVDAPFAASVRDKIAASLDPKRAREPVGRSSTMHSLGTGQYRALTSLSMSSSGVSQVSSMARSGSGAVLAITPDMVSTSTPPVSKRRRGVALAGLAAGVVVLAAFLATRSETAPSAATVSAAGAPRETVAALANTSVVLALPQQATSFAAVAAAAADAGFANAPFVASPSDNKRAVAPTRPSPAAHPAPAPAVAARAVNPPPAAEAAAATPAAPISAPAQETPKKRGNPLEERQ